MSSRNRSFVFTLNNYNEEEYKEIIEVCTLHSKKYIIGKEVGEKGTPHLQGYINLNNGKTFKKVQELLNNKRIHIEIAKGNPQQNFEYCSKEKNYVSSGFNNDKDKELEEWEKNLYKFFYGEPTELRNEWERREKERMRKIYLEEDEKYGLE